MKIKRGSTSVRRLIFIGDSTSTTGAGLTGLVYNSAGLTAYYFAGDLSNEVQITLATATLGSYTSGGFVEVDATNMPGWYEVGIPDAALDGGNEVAIQYRGATNMVPVNIYIELDAVDYQSATNFGLSKFADIEADTQNIQSRLPAALVSGRIDASVGAMATNTLTGSALSTDAADEIAERVANLDILTSPYSTNTWGRVARDTYINLATVDVIVNAILTDTADMQPKVATAAEIADAVYDEPYADHTTAGTYGFLWDKWRKSNPTITGEVTAAITPTTTTFSTDITGYADTAFDNAVLVFINGSTNADFRGVVSGYLQANGQVTITPALPQAPVAGDEFVIAITSFVYTTTQTQSGLATSAGVTAAFTEIKGATWDSGTDTLEAIRNASGGGGGTSALLPCIGVVPVRVDQTILTAFVGETIDVAIVVYQSDGTTPMDLSGKTLEVCFESTSTTDVAVVDNANITVSGDDNNIVTFAYPSAVTGSVANYYWSLRDAAAPKTVWQYGTLYVKRAALKD